MNEVAFNLLEKSSLLTLMLRRPLDHKSGEIFHLKRQYPGLELWRGSVIGSDQLPGVMTGPGVVVSLGALCLRLGCAMKAESLTWVAVDS